MGHPLRRYDYESRYLCGADQRWRSDDLNQSCGHVIDEAGYDPVGRQRRNCPQQSHVDGNRCVGIADRFLLEFPFRYLKIAGQHGGVMGKASDPAIGVLKNDDVKLAASAGHCSGNFTDSPEQSQFPPTLLG